MGQPADRANDNVVLVTDYDYKLKEKDNFKYIFLELDQWEEQFKPKKAIQDDTYIARYETYGEDLDFIKAQPLNKIWTLMVDEATDTMFITNGFRLVNRLGYFITEEPWSDDTIYLIEDETVFMLKDV
jgi:hypothetical protein